MSTLVREPMYQQLNNHRTPIKSGEYAQGQFLPSGKSANDSASAGRRPTKPVQPRLRRLLEFRKGIGTLVRGRALDYNLRSW
jgi:hypothetical protein